jgi:hypothetical protein
MTLEPKLQNINGKPVYAVPSEARLLPLLPLREERAGERRPVLRTNKNTNNIELPLLPP